MKKVAGDLPDINVWVALTTPDHISRRRAERYRAHEADEKLLFCRITTLGLLRVCCGPHSPSKGFLSPEDAWERYRMLRGIEAISFLPEPRQLEAIMEQWIRNRVVTPRNWTDAYLAAFAVSASLRLVSFDADFKKFPGLNFLHLSD